MQRRRWFARATILLILVAVAAATRMTVCAPQPILVRTARVERGVVEETVTNSRAGTVKARRRAKLSPETGGRVVALPFRKGERVRAGQVVLRLDDATQRANLKLARREREVALAQSEQACLTADRAERELARIGRLADQQIVSPDMLDGAASQSKTAAAACRAARASVGRAEAAIGLAEVELRKTVVRAPFDGLIAEVMTEVGEWTTPAPPAIPIPPVLDIVDLRSIYISAPMDEVDSARVRVGQEARVSVDSFPGRRFAARITRVTPYVLDRLEQNRTVEVEAELTNPQEAVAYLPGTSADAEVILSTRVNAVRVPVSALLEGRKVLVVGQGRLSERAVEVGLRNWDYCEIQRGVSVGEEVVTSLEGPEIRPGVRVRVDQQS